MPQPDLRQYYLQQMGIDTWLLRQNKVQLKQLDQLEAEVAACVRCPLHSMRKQALFSRGNPNAQLMLIADGPTHTEDQQGLLFTSNAFRLLLNMLKSIGLTEQDVYITTILKCKLPDNRLVSSNELNHCSGYLNQQIAYVSPKLIIVTGDLATRFLLNTTLPVSELRNDIHYYQGTPVLVSYHPANLLEHPVAKKQAYADFLFIEKFLNDYTKL